ncbi:YbbR-like domain-containing protein [Seonamhaeicola maritimus]|uniref:YbbR-like domain-containing protein n=1 Tax=Seonamhaeicola maritimus TaxID=2591822 RepID=UPI001F4F4E92|nr:YbbR-like domain-containing protein [Seonamhaeicola maritimus]
MIKKVKSKIASSIKSKRINVFLLFLLFAFIILIFSKLSKEYTNTVSFEIEKLNVPEEQVILNDSTTLDITLKTHGFKWLNYYFEKPKIVIDFNKDVTKTESVYIYSKSTAYLNNTQFDKQVELLSKSPDTLVFRYDVNLVKKVPVKLNADIKFSAGYNITKPVSIEPDSVVVIGPHILVSEINSLETEKVEFIDIRQDLQEKAKLKLPKHSADLKFSTSTINLRATVEKFTEGTLKVPIRTINVPDSISLKYFPKEVNVSYYVSLDNFNAVKINDFRLVCDYAKVKGNQSFLVPELIQFPETIKNPKINQQQIEFIISK